MSHWRLTFFESYYIMYTAYPDRKEGCKLKELPDWEEYESAEPRDDQEDLMPGGGKNSLTAFYIVVSVFVLAMILMVIFMGVDKSEDKTEPESSTEVSAKTESTPGQTPPSSSQQDSSQEDQSYPVKDRSEPEQLGKLGDLKDAIEAKFENYPGEWSAYVKDLRTGDWFSINDKPFYPASVIKLFAMGACYQQIQEGKIDEQTYYPTIVSMAAYSNNSSFNKMVRTMGTTYINRWCSSMGYSKTFQYHGLEPSDNADGLTTSDKPNATCASDVGHMLEDIYRGTCVSKEASEKMYEILKQQYYTEKIPHGIPYSPSTVIANKTGDTTNQSHDAAIVSTPNSDYILVILSEEENRASKHGMYFIELSSLTYSYFSGAQGTVPVY